MDNKIEEMTIEQLNNATKNPLKSGLTLKEVTGLAKAVQELKGLSDRLKEEKFVKLTWWGKVKSLFSKRPVYIKKD